MCVYMYLSIYYANHYYYLCFSCLMYSIVIVIVFFIYLCIRFIELHSMCSHSIHLCISINQIIIHFAVVGAGTLDTGSFLLVRQTD